jgi:ADP-heptose:LPS heptosyltransferase
MESLLIKQKFSTGERTLYPGELYICDDKVKQTIKKAFTEYANRTGKRGIFDSIEFVKIDSIFKKLHKDSNVKNLLIMRYGGAGDIMALSSIIDYFDVTTHFVTQKKYFPIFDWFENKPKIYDVSDKLFTNFKKTDKFTRFNDWFRFHVEGGHKKNWFELFFEFIEEPNPGIEFYRPQLRTERINNKQSNIQRLSTGKPSLLICNKATAMMRTCYASEIIQCLPMHVKEKFSIFVHESNLDKDEIVNGAILIDKTDFNTYLLDLYDSDMVISVDTGAIHFREGIEKPAIGLYNSFTTESRTKYYKFTKSFDLDSDCELHPCFVHEKLKIKHCPKGEAGMYSSPCFDMSKNKTLEKQLTNIFNEELN